ncbi:MAG: hypothetical protein QXO82_00820 [Candidatus Methanomethylicia archaeon]
MPIPEEKKEPYKEVGGTNSEIKTFLIKYPWAADANQTTINLFLWWKNATNIQNFYNGHSNYLKPYYYPSSRKILMKFRCYKTFLIKEFDELGREK